jgi:hypothetical protein
MFTAIVWLTALLNVGFAVWNICIHQYWLLPINAFGAACCLFALLNMRRSK